MDDRFVTLVAVYVPVERTSVGATAGTSLDEVG
jgi:hypothetical protein